MSTTNTTPEQQAQPTKVQIPWASKPMHQAIAEVCINNAVTPEDYLDSLRVDSDYIENGRRISGKAVMSIYYTIKMEKSALARVTAIKASKAEAKRVEEANVQAPEGGAE